MPFDPAMHHRHSIRLHGYDYARPGAYFVTVCTQHRERRFGEIMDGVMQLNPVGEMVWRIWDAMPTHCPGIEIDAFMVMPDHMHGIIQICPSPRRHESVGAGLRACPSPRCHEPVGAGPCACPSPRCHEPVGAGPCACPDHEHGQPGQSRGAGQPQGVAPASLARAVHHLKSMTTHAYMQGVRQWGWPAFQDRLWQRNYWERIIRNELELACIRQYIRDNPKYWNP
ncbi:MAG: hypothetical protein QM612_06490 [Thermomonas sp.]|uniref:transposase n=1 Tax=Thermomonas sp. TaxID=1971895 RepID=UPI0039E41219